MNIVLTGGGTGGHVYPAISIAEKLRDTDRNINILYIGSADSIEERVAKENSIDFASVHSASLPDFKSKRVFSAFCNLIRGRQEALKLLKDFRCDAVFGTGGYVCYPVFMAQKKRNRPIIIHEQNAIGGTTNRKFSRYAEYVCTTFDNRDFPPEKTVKTGLPIRKIFRESIPKKSFCQEYGISEEKFTVLVCGGSQGAKSINDALVSALPELKNMDIEIIHQTGKKKYNDVLSRTKDINAKNYHIYDFTDMFKALNTADLVISRAGASTLTEILTSGVPSVLIPFPYAASDHQYFNAKSSADAGASLLIEDKNLTGDILAEKIKYYRNSPDILKEMSLNTKKALVSDPEKKIAELIIRTAQRLGVL